MAEPRRWREVERRTSGLSLAVVPRDFLTGAGALDAVDLTVDGAAPDARAGGAAVYLDLPAEPVELLLDGGDRYRDVDRTLDLAARDPAAPVVLDAVPTTAYDVPGWATAIRGVVSESAADDADPVPGAVVTVDVPAPPADPDAEDPYADLRDYAVETDAGGGFLYVVPGADALASDDGERLAVDGADPTLRATLPDGTEVTEREPVELGDVTRIDLPAQ